MAYRVFRTFLICSSLTAIFSMTALAADIIAGVVRNQTRSQLAVGDEVVLLRMNPAHLSLGTQVEARANTDSQGSFNLKVRYPHAPHLVRVIHQGVNYDREAPLGGAISIDVFDATAKVSGITGTIEIIRIGNNGQLLHVSDMIEIKNDSSPPLTQAGDRTFEVYLPAHAKIDSVLAASSGIASEKIGVLISAASVPGEPGNYTVNFPLRPGTTKFAFNYDLPYAGSAKFYTRRKYPVQQLAVMIPPTMKFTSSSHAFQLLRTGNDRYKVDAASQVRAGEGPGFAISGVGALPVLQSQAQQPSKPPVTAITTPDLTASGSSRGQAQSSADVSRSAPASKFSSSSVQLQRWLQGSFVLLLAILGYLLGRRQRLAGMVTMKESQRTKQLSQTSTRLIEALREELVQLELDRSLGAVSGEEYASAKLALEGTAKRALARTGATAISGQPSKSKQYFDSHTSFSLPIQKQR
jgi:hypothetical protein